MQTFGKKVGILFKLGEDIYANEVASFLLERSLLPSKEEEMPRIIRSPTNQDDSDSD